VPEERQIEYSTSASPTLPNAPKPLGQWWLKSLAFKTCPGSSLSITVVKFVNAGEVLLPSGMVSDSWWVVRCGKLPNRVLRLCRGETSMNNLILRYGFMDDNGCVHHGHTVMLTYSSAPNRPDCHIGGDYDVPNDLFSACGVPQFQPKSGVCWFAAMVWTMRVSPLMFKLLEAYMPPKMYNLLRESIFKRESALALRHMLWDLHAVGDDTGQPPEKDGKNGCSEFITLCAQLKVPLLQYNAIEKDVSMQYSTEAVKDQEGNVFSVTPPSSLSEPHILVLRFLECNHEKFPLWKRFKVNGVRYKLAGMYLGQSFCGHQLGVACTGDDTWRNWAITDADMHKDGIGPSFCSFKDGQSWWDAWKYIIHVTKFNGGNMCNHSPHNPPTSAPKGRTSRGAGSNSVDAVYVADVTFLRGAQRS